MSLLSGTTHPMMVSGWLVGTHALHPPKPFQSNIGLVRAQLLCIYVVSIIVSPSRQGSEIKIRRQKVSFHCGTATTEVTDGKLLRFLEGHLALRGKKKLWSRV